MTANTDKHEQLRLIFLEQVGHLITDGTIETRSLKRAGISFACGNLHAAFLAWQAARRAPVVPEKESLRECAMRDLSYANGMLVGWNRCVEDDEEGFELIRNHLTSEAIKALKALAAAPQPPEVDHIPDAGKMVAAPVQLPECAGKTIAEPKDFDDGCCLSWRGGMPPPRGTNLYTEQQVRQLLAAQEQST